MASEVTGSNNTSSMELDIDLNDVLSILGINLPSVPVSGSLPELPKKLKFKPRHNLKSLIKDMIDSDLKLAKKESELRK
jgi:hypothetical protein